jgi:hypothetical protein
MVTGSYIDRAKRDAVRVAVTEGHLIVADLRVAFDPGYGITSSHPETLRCLKQNRN